MKFGFQKNLCNSLITLGFILSANSLFAHGMDEPGPHQGRVQMPSTYHTEILIENSQDVKVYLLDIEFKNPVTEKSEVLAVFESGRTKVDMPCMAENDYFICRTRQTLNFKRGKLRIKSHREDAKGSDVIYDLPLKEWKKPATKARKKSLQKSHH